ncbi:DUF3800 domain-containing protein [Promicromonospora sp. NPDC057138]|uniref:DUF3800 domain-containing protein n=1 Tax=Promicromonospora sp. NPDC057138 TaxID=3346031 RepID=UPI00363C902D
MLLAYIDESFNRDHYRTVGLIISSPSARALTAALDRVVADAAEAYPDVKGSFELHGHDLFRASAQWSALEPMVRARISIYRKALQAIAEHVDAFYVEGLQRDAFRRRYAGQQDEHVTVLLHLLEKLDQYAAQRDQDLLVVADEHHTARVAQEALRATRTEAVWGYRGSPRKIVDTVYFVPSTMSRLVQAADMVAFLHQRIAGGLDRDERAVRANKDLWSIIAPRLKRERLWTPS